MASLQASLRILIADVNSLAEVAQRLNELFIHNIRLTQFVTLFLARYDPKTRALQYCNAGHNPPLLYRAAPQRTEVVQWLQPTGPAIGLIETAQFKSEVITLLPGDVLLLYTDGVTEARNPQEEEFTTTRLVDVIRQHPQQAPADLVRELRSVLQAFTQGHPPADDTTIVAGRLAD
jgi:sigma-B regulation protein RsbU (phosphoserine phosphatase)